MVEPLESTTVAPERLMHMPKFAFGKRKSTAEGDNDAAPPSFRVLDRSEVNDGVAKPFDGGARLSTKLQGAPRTAVSDLSYEDNLFADFKPNTTNRYVSLIPVGCCVQDSSGRFAMRCVALPCPGARGASNPISPYGAPESW